LGQPEDVAADGGFDAEWRSKNQMWPGFPLTNHQFFLAKPSSESCRQLLMMLGVLSLTTFLTTHQRATANTPKETRVGPTPMALHHQWND
jgi:hypothetical protein